MSLAPAAADGAHAVRRPSAARAVATFVLALAALQIVVFLVANPRFEWSVVWKHLFDATILAGVGKTIVLTVIAMTVGSVIGTVMAVLLMNDWRPGRWAASAYLWLFRGTPVLIQLIFWYNLAYLLPTLSIGLPFSEPIASWKTNEAITPFLAAVL